MFFLGEVMAKQMQICMLFTLSQHMPASWSKLVVFGNNAINSSSKGHVGPERVAHHHLLPILGKYLLSVQVLDKNYK